MLCPLCNVELALSEKQGIEIDYCPKCRGIWLDRGELDKIIERSSENEDGSRNKQSSANNNSGYRDNDNKYNSQDYHKNKRKSFLGDLFDF